MAFPNETELPEPQFSNSSPTTPPTPAAAECPSAEIAENQAQEEDEVADAFDTEDHHSEQAKDTPNPVVPSPAVEGTTARADQPQQQDRTETVTTASETTTTPNDVVSDGEEDSGSEFQDSSDSEEENVEDPLDDKIFVEPEPKSQIGEDPNLQMLSRFNADFAQEPSIRDDIRNYVRPVEIDGNLFEDYQVDTWDDENRRIAETGCNSEANQATPDQAVQSTPATFSHGDGGNSSSMAGAATGPDHDKAVTTAPLSSELGDRDNKGSTTLTSTGRDCGDGENRGSATPTSTDFNQGDSERSGSVTPALASGPSEEDNNEPRTPNSTCFNREDEEPRTSVVTTPADSDHGDEETRGSMTTTSAGPDDGDGESSRSMIPALASSGHGDVESSELRMATPAGSDQAAEKDNGSVSSGVASEEETPAPGQEDEDTQRDVGEDEIPDDSSMPTEATPTNTTGEGGHQEPTATPTQEIQEETASQSDVGTDHGQEMIDLRPPEIPDSPLQPTPPLGEDPNNIDLDDGEAAPNPVDRVAIVTGYPRPEVRGLNDNEYEEGHTAESNQAASQDPSSSKPDQQVTEGNKDSKTVHLRIQYNVEGSKRSKATMCISVPVAMTYPSFETTILNALHHHEGFDNPRPIAANAQISRLIAVLAKKADDEPDFRRERVLTAVNLQETLSLMTNRSIYDVVKVQFVPGTNGVVRPRKATGRVNGRSRKIGRL